MTARHVKGNIDEGICDRSFCFSPQWKGEIQEFCPNTKMLLVGCKSDLRTDLSTLVELSNHRQTPVSYDQVCRHKAIRHPMNANQSWLITAPSIHIY